jgi:hypothetical protein
MRQAPRAWTALFLGAILAGSSATALAAEEPPRLVLCLAQAADGTPVYPLEVVPSNHREVVVAWRLREGEVVKSLTHVWTVVDVREAAPAGTVIVKETLDLKGLRFGVLAYTMPRDVPEGTYKVDAIADGTAWPPFSFRVGAPTKAVPLGKPEDLVPLAVGTTWTFAHTAQKGPGIKNLTMSGMEKGADGTLRGTVTYTAAASDAHGTRIEMRRGDALINEEWWRLDAGGLAVTHVRRGGQEADLVPPATLLRLPLEASASWSWTQDGATTPFRMWGPLPVVGPAGSTPGYVVWSAPPTAAGGSTVERHFVPGVGLVREVHTDGAKGLLRFRLELSIAPAK